MGRQSIEWHQQCIANFRMSVAATAKQLRALQQEHDEQLVRLEQYEAQVSRAIAEGRDGFDADKFNLKKGGE
jgi:phage shock protein A